MSNFAFNANRFDRSVKNSPFLTFVAQEFSRRGTPFRLQLAQKEFSSNFVEDLGLKAAKKILQIDDIDQLSSEHLGEKAVLKYARGWSSRGVMLLERIDEKTYFDHMALLHYTIDEIVERQKRVANSFGHESPFWLIEEFLSSAQTVGAMTFDYKFHAFQGEIAFIAQIDRNTYPPKIALFDGKFKPLKLGKDYLLSSSEVHPGVPLIPYNAIEMLWWASELSKKTDSPFVRVDLYDTPSEPYFGEFTFSPGPVHKKQYIFSKDMLNLFDRLHLESEMRMNGYGSGDNTSFHSKLGELNHKEIRAIRNVPRFIYQHLGGITYNDGSRGALRMMEHYKYLLSNETDSVAQDAYKILINGWENVRILLRNKSKDHIREYS